MDAMKQWFPKKHHNENFKSKYDLYFLLPTFPPLIKTGLLQCFVKDSADPSDEGVHSSGLIPSLRGSLLCTFTLFSPLHRGQQMFAVN